MTTVSEGGVVGPRGWKRQEGPQPRLEPWREHSAAAPLMSDSGPRAGREHISGV